MAKKQTWKGSNPDLRRKPQCPSPPVELIEQRLWELLSPATFKPLKASRDVGGHALRSRLLTLPVMVAVVMGLIYRQINSLSELIRTLHGEGLLWVAQMKVSQEALSKRFRRLPVELFVELLAEVQAKIASRPSGNVLSSAWQGIEGHFTVVWIADGSTLEELRCHLKALQERKGTVLAGKMMAVIELFSRRLVEVKYTADSQANDKVFGDWLLQKLPSGGLLVVDLGFFKFGWFDQATEKNCYFLTRLRDKTAYSVTRVLSQGERYRDEIVTFGKYRSNPCKHPVRMVSVLWGSTWYRYITNVLEPKQLTAQQVCELYRCRWRIEDAFAITKRLLGLSYLWVGDVNGVQIQIVCTWIFYAVLNDLCAEVAIALHQPLERISVEMVFRALYHYSRACLREPETEIMSFYRQHSKLLGLVKAQRQRHRQVDAQLQEIWGSA
jgi:hypothetical protein